MRESRRGAGYGAAAYLLWGAFPLYFPLLRPASAVEILAHRVFWSMVVTVGLVLLLRRWDRMRALLANRRQAGILTLAAACVSLNWVTYIWGVNHGRVVETSLGYFINPLVTVLLGVLILGERLRAPQWAALGIGALAVGVLTWDYGRPPWIALILAFSFGTYGLLKKFANAGAVESLAFETAVLSPVALSYLIWLQVQGTASLGQHGLGHTLLLLSTGIVTAIPLMLFGAAAIRVSLTTLGLLQYLAPILQFLLGVLWLHEQMTPGRWMGFCLVWAALAVFTADSIRHHRRELQLSAEATAL